MNRYPSDVSQSVYSSPLPNSPIPAPKSSNFIALRKLKETDNQLDLMKRRLSALLIKEQKLNRKSQTAIKKIKYHQMIQQMQKKEREKKLLYKKELETKVEIQRRMNSSQRMTRKQKLQEVKNSFYQMKASCYKVQRQVSKQLQSRIKFLGQQEQKNRKEMYSQIKKYQAQSRKHYQIYRLQKQSEIRWQKEMEHSRLVDQQERKEIKRQDLADMERQIIQRQARSRQAAERSTSDLKRIIDPRVSLSANKQALKDSMLKLTKNPEEDL